jgi:amino acid adenylation domain-containing protein
MKDLIHKLKANNIHLFVDKDVLKVRFNDANFDEDLIDEIKNHKSEIIDYLKVNLDGSAFETIPRSELQPSYVLSSSQHRLWVTCQYHDALVAYNIPRAEAFEGELDYEALEAAFKKLTDRHEILRTVFREDEGGSIRQWINPVNEHPFALKYQDLRHMAAGPQKQELLDELVRQDQQMPFDLSSDSLLRLNLYHVEDKKWVFSYVIHHIISDGWSLNVMIKELMTLYLAYTQGKEDKLPPLSIQYKDYAAWQQARLENGQLKDFKEYWLKKLGGELPVLKLMGDRPRPSIKTYNGDKITRIFNKDVVLKLKHVCDSGGATLFMGLLAGLNALLFRYTDQEDIIIGSPIAGREHPDLDDQLGFYLNTLALRTEFSRNDSFEDLLQNVKKVSLDAFDHQAYPFDELINNLALKRDVSRSPLFDVAMVFQNTGIAGRDLQPGTMQNLQAGSYTSPMAAGSKFDLSFDFSESGDVLIVHLEFNTDIYDKSTAEHILTHLEQLFASAVDLPSTLVAELKCLTEEEIHQLLDEFNDAPAKPDRNAIIPLLFEEQVKNNPGNIAVLFGEKALTYAELNVYTNRLSAYLKGAYNIQCGDSVGVMLGRSEWMIVAIMATLKSGAAYVPIDQEYPQERINFLKEDTGCKVIIDAAELEKFMGLKENYSAENSEIVNTPADLAYIMYTSGSTGKPKGVMVEHKSVVRLVKQCNYISISNNDRILGLSNYSFDGSVFDIFGSLLNGAALVIPSKEIMLDSKKLAELIAKSNVTIFFVTTALFNVIADSGMASLEHMKYVLFGGEQVSVSRVKRFRELYNSVNLVHVYGPTECTTFSTYFSVNEVSDNTITIPIGKGILDSQCYVLSRELQLQPVGVAGEIYIGGRGLARGYWNNQELTSQKFIPDPFKAGEKMYKTGDFVRWLPGGNIEFIGREDDQVKVRGYRIELPEIELALKTFEPIQGAVVTVKQDLRGEKNLLAYIVSTEMINKVELRMHLKHMLPDYMIPDFFIQMDRLPLTVNGKIDKKVLPEPESLSVSRMTEYVAPRNVREEKLVDIWSEILGMDKEKIGIKDNFFDLGGHSLKAIRLKNRINKEFSLKYDLKGLYVESTIEMIAEKIRLDEWLAASELNNDNNYEEVKI